MSYSLQITVYPQITVTLKRKLMAFFFLEVYYKKVLLKTELFIYYETTKFPETHPMQSIVEGRSSYCEATRFPGTHPMQSIVEGWGFYCEATRFPGTHPMQSIVEGRGSYFPISEAPNAPANLPNSWVSTFFPNSFSKSSTI